MKLQTVIKLIISLALPLSVGAIAGSFTAEAIPDWYASLNRPSFNPPSWLFAPVWTSLYILMGISLFMIWMLPESKERNRALFIFGVQMALNFLWSFLFFYFKAIGVALVEIVLLWSSILLMIVLFYRLKPLTGYLNIPYILWVSFASILNAAYYLLN